jgi:citrate synthase
MSSDTKDIGLRGIPVADTNICLIDGEKGELYYRGYDIHDLAKNSSYEEVAYLLIYSELPTKTKLEGFKDELKKERTIPSEVVEQMKLFPVNANPMDVLQSSISMLAAFDVDIDDDSEDANQKKASKIVAKTATIVAYWDRIRNKENVVAPRKDLTHAENFLHMLKGEAPKKEFSKDLDICLILHAEHSFNASTFTARVVASTRAHIYASLSAACGSLSGPLHGGANTRVMRTLLNLGDPNKVEGWVVKQFDDDKRVMGMGHAIYHVMDPRAKILDPIGEKLGEELGEPKWHKMVKTIDEVTRREFKKRKGGDIFPNVDLYSAPVYYMLGIPPDLYTAVFATSRVAGWSAHVLEEKYPQPPVKPMLYRPTSDYIGHYCGPTGCVYEPLNKR